MDNESHLRCSEHAYEEYQQMMDFPDRNDLKNSRPVRELVRQVENDLREEYLKDYQRAEDCHIDATIAVGIGDVTSNAPGSGARYNAGKPAYDLLPLSVMVKLDAVYLQHSASEAAGAALYWLGKYQKCLTRDTEYLYNALTALYSGEQPRQYWDDIARVLDYGRKKYAAWNWSKGMPWSVPLACAARHCMAMVEGEEDDLESGLPHEAHVAANIVFLLTYKDTYPEGNDLPTTLKPKNND